MAWEGPWSSLQPEGGREGAQSRSGRAAGRKGPTGGVGRQKRGSLGRGKACSMSPAPLARIPVLYKVVQHSDST